MDIRLNMISKGIRCLKKYGMREFTIRASEHLKPATVPYSSWYKKHKMTAEEWNMQREDSEAWENRPMVSICVPLYQTPEEYLCQMIDSVRSQTYTNWQLCLADGTRDNSVEAVIEQHYKDEKRIRYKHLEENLGIAENTNEAFALADGEWIALLDHDDLLAPEALYEMLAAAGVHVAAASMVKRVRGNWQETADVVYSDEDKVSENLKKHFQPHFKPDFNPQLLCSNNYITHFFMAKRSIVEQVGGFRREYDGSQDYDFIFRCTDAASRIAHVPRILYYWRTSATSTADNPESKLYAFEAGKRAIEEHLRTKNIPAEVLHTKSLGFYRVKYEVAGQPPVSIIIPNKDEKAVLQKCLEAIAKSSYQNYEVIVVENNSEALETFAYYEELLNQKYEADKILEGTIGGNKSLKLITYKGIFNYSAINNYGVSVAKGDYLVLMNNDVEMITEDWIEEMLGHCQQKENGAVGCKLLYPDGTIQHAGVVIGIGGIANHMFIGMKGDHYGYMHRAAEQMNYSAVTAACMMIKRSAYEAVGGLNEELEVAFNDVDFCLRLGEAGYRIVYTPYASGFHYESKSRGKDDTPAKAARFAKEVAYMEKHWEEILKNGDPCYNPNLSLKKTDYSLNPSV